MSTISDLMDRMSTLEPSELAAALQHQPALVHERSALANTLLHAAGTSAPCSRAS